MRTLLSSSVHLVPFSLLPVHSKHLGNERRCHHLNKEGRVDESLGTRPFNFESRLYFVTYDCGPLCNMGELWVLLSFHPVAVEISKWGTKIMLCFDYFPHVMLFSVLCIHCGVFPTFQAF